MRLQQIVLSLEHNPQFNLNHKNKSAVAKKESSFRLQLSLTFPSPLMWNVYTLYECYGVLRLCLRLVFFLSLSLYSYNRCIYIYTHLCTTDADYSVLLIKLLTCFDFINHVVGKDFFFFSMSNARSNFTNKLDFCEIKKKLSVKLVQIDTLHSAVMRNPLAKKCQTAK